MNTKRLINFYHACMECPETVEGIWGEILKIHHVPLVNALKAGDEAGLKAILNNNQVLYGIEGYNLVQWTEPHARDRLNDLGQRMGLVNYFNPEQPSPTNNWKHQDSGQLQRLIENKVGSLNIPECFGRAPLGNLGAPITSLWTVAQFTTLDMHVKWFANAVLEIGAGIGLAAYFAKRYGCGRYTIIDLPTTAVISAYCLSTILGEDTVWLYGEPETNAYVKIYPAVKCTEVNDRFSMVFNANSFPEIPIPVQDRYVQKMPQWLGMDGIFYSCNHESDVCDQRSVSAALNDSLRRIYRAPFMVRAGYVEEMFVTK